MPLPEKSRALTVIEAQLVCRHAQQRGVEPEHVRVRGDVLEEARVLDGVRLGESAPAKGQPGDISMEVVREARCLDTWVGWQLATAERPLEIGRGDVLGRLLEADRGPVDGGPVGFQQQPVVERLHRLAGGLPPPPRLREHDGWEDCVAVAVEGLRVERVRLEDGAAAALGRPLAAPEADVQRGHRVAEPRGGREGMGGWGREAELLVAQAALRPHAYQR